MRKPSAAVDKDSLWKEFLNEFFLEFIQFSLPDLFLDTDWTHPPEFLEQELLNAIKGKYKIPGKKKFSDKLVKLRLKNGKNHFVLVHVEQQHLPEEEFARRMFTYFALIYLRYGIEEITAIALFTGKQPKESHKSYKLSLYETRLEYQFKAVVLEEMEVAQLEKSENLFGIASLAALLTFQHESNERQLMVFKEKVFELALRKNVSEEKLVKFLTFVRDYMHLPDELENEFERKQYS